MTYKNACMLIRITSLLQSGGHYNVIEFNLEFFYECPPMYGAFLDMHFSIYVASLFLICGASCLAYGVSSLY